MATNVLVVFNISFFKIIIKNYFIYNNYIIKCVSFLWDFMKTFIHSFKIQSCLTTGPQPLPKRVSTDFDLMLLLSISSILSFPQGHPVASCVSCIVFPSLLSFPLSFFSKMFQKAVPTQDMTNRVSLLFTVSKMFPSSFTPSNTSSFLT